VRAPERWLGWGGGSVCVCVCLCVGERRTGAAAHLSIPVRICISQFMCVFCTQHNIRMRICMYKYIYILRPNLSTISMYVRMYAYTQQQPSHHPSHPPSHHTPIPTHQPAAPRIAVTPESTPVKNPDFFSSKLKRAPPAAEATHLV